MNLATVAAEAGLIDHTQATKADLVAHSPVAAQQDLADRAAEEKRLDQWIKDETVKSAQRNGRKVSSYEEYEKAEMPFFGVGPAAQAQRRLWLQQQQEKAIGGWN